MGFEWIDFLIAKRAWSYKVFGNDYPLDKVIQHIESELQEIRETPNDLFEWVDVILLALDGAFRAGHTPYQVMTAIYQKHQINTEREWGDSVLQNSPTFHKEYDEEMRKKEAQDYGGNGFGGGPSGQGGDW